ncbi:hypothetical protein [Castellaniella sp.]|uniref:hypothetical protein n=1 Tax=Castellaniella sp. TaxID=1955812 RepID=UPI002AFFFDA5|nr:hypothetical protein [Castellaniella sp.]
MDHEIDALERAAGIETAEQRAVFWRQFGHLSPPDMLSAGRDALMQLARSTEGNRSAAALQVEPDKAKSPRPLWLKILIWPLKVILAIIRKMVLFILIYGLPFALLCRFTGIIVALFGVMALAMVIDGKPEAMPLWQVGLVFLGSAFMWGIAAGWQKLLDLMLPEDEILIQPYN